MLFFVLSVLIPCVFMCGMRQQAAGRWGPEASMSGKVWANLHKTNMAADQTCVPDNRFDYNQHLKKSKTILITVTITAGSVNDCTFDYNYNGNEPQH